MSYSFNGSTQYISLTNPLSGTPITMAAWFNSSTTTAQGIITISDATGANRVGLNAQGNLAARSIRAITVGTGGSGASDTPTGYTTNVWAHACGVFASATSRTSYINGVAATANTTSITTGTFDRMYIGATRAASANTNFLNGSIAEVGVWSVALTANEIASLADGVACIHVRPQSLVFYGPLIRQLIDIKARATLTNNATATVATHTRIYY